MAWLIEAFKRLIRKFQNAFLGLKAGILYDRSILVQMILAIISLIFFYLLKISYVEWLFVITAIFVVVVSEFLNSAIEDVCDLLVKKYDLHVKEIKDIAAAAVLLAAIYAVVVAIFIIGRRIL
ncbi:MAG: diacylglycerol kinase family protein [Erysipelothrix sp.]|nr:diacylglycerol kinase family protein [Erysipelothrix sp.]